ncbi:hypothetical protein [Nocardia sp. NRRL S-836]|uniref:hypothetical protein n=1 Tax=Nocardia sp. NRRL S-836 TaxID=1519492 RepID=UPI0006B06AFB|nr:hypothetical protein [Nocardia sp. NRRL S-836]KOV87241.1 hypothetical protein ADL03_07890 [Nocardia sp. NRRL S-836]
MPISQDRGRAAEARLREIAGPDLYRRNPFRVIGLATDAKPARVRAQRHLLLGAFDLGAVPGDRRLPLPQPPSTQDVRQAFDAVERPEQRLVDELFWWWGDPDGCGCPREVHELHDSAVEAHAKALDTVTDDDLWVDAADGWMDALDHPRFWDHVRHRIGALADRRMDESTVGSLREALPRALLAPQVALAPARPELARLLSSWDVPRSLIDDGHRMAAEPTSGRIDALINEVVALLDSGSGPAAATKAEGLPALANLLESLAPHAQHRWSARQRNRTAVVLNNCALALGKIDQRRSRALLRQALGFAVEDRDRDTIERNMASRSASSWEADVVEQLRAGNRAEALRRLRLLRQKQLSPLELAEVEAMLHQLTTSALRPALWPSNLMLCALFVAAVVVCVSGLLGWPTWVAAIATAALSWMPFTVIGAGWYRSLIGGTASAVIGFAGFALGWNVVENLPPEALEPFLWSGGVFVLASPFAHAVAVAGKEL